MTGGTILVDGSTGNDVCLNFRRGLVAVGACGDFVGANMIAGTALVFGACGNRPAANMRRGTVGLFGGDPPTLLVSFKKSGTFKPPFLRPMFRYLRTLGFAVPDECLDANYSVYHGDHVSVGRGEILIRERE